MGDYIRITKLLLPESAKYLVLLLVVVLAIRLWRRWIILPAGQRRNNLIAACVATVLAVGLGYFSMCHSLGLLYSYYGTRALEAGNLLPALSLFDQSARYWKSPEAVGKGGVCLLLSGKTEEGIRGIEEAKALRHGQNDAFEQFYEGVYDFFRNQPDKAGPLLEGASGETALQWNVTKLLAAIAFESNRPEEAERLLSRFTSLEIPDADADHAYVVASLELFKGKTAEAKALLARFPAGKLSAFWQPRFEKLRARTQS